MLRVTVWPACPTPTVGRDTSGPTADVWANYPGATVGGKHR